MVSQHRTTHLSALPPVALGESFRMRANRHADASSTERCPSTPPLTSSPTIPPHPAGLSSPSSSAVVPPSRHDIHCSVLHCTVERLACSGALPSMVILVTWFDTTQVCGRQGVGSRNDPIDGHAWWRRKAGRQGRKRYYGR